MIATNSDNAEESYRISSKNADSASQGSQKISALISTMRNVATSASKIEEITVVIDDIAFQTNLLALNAAVEAARAGEQGKGFAVVADAVRSLAQKSAQSTKEINELIKEMVDISTKGSELADESGQVLDEIVKSIKQTSELTKMISEASKEQSAGIKQVTEAMNTIDRITQGNADTSNQVSENSGQMAGQAETLKDVAQELSMLIHGKNAAADKAA
jgi:methyl-accepting chemotaxis protein